MRLGEWYRFSTPVLGREGDMCASGEFGARARLIVSKGGEKGRAYGTGVCLLDRLDPVASSSKFFFFFFEMLSVAG